ncbi:anthranilate synthase component I [Lentisphaerota bacterium WC36G]|nr:anthranilate synthase component I [Lentisphaerae bacterium WC36]
MITPLFNEFEKMYEGISCTVPVAKEYLADVETPVSVLARLNNLENIALFESVEGGERWGRYSILCLNPESVLTINDNCAVHKDIDGTLIEENKKEPFELLRKILKENATAENSALAPFSGGALGYLSYEAARYFDRQPQPKGQAGVADAMFMIGGNLIIFDNVKHTIKVVCIVKKSAEIYAETAYNKALNEIDNIANLVFNAPSNISKSMTVKNRGLNINTNITKEQFISNVEKAKEEIRNGEIIQVVLSQKFCCPQTSDEISLYRALRYTNPSPYTFFLKMADITLIGSSPEVMTRLKNNIATVRPIAGTRPRGANEQMDRDLANELLNDSKERAEHVMLVDLGRNDLGRVAESSSVKVKDFMTIERYSHVMHIVSNIEAQLDPNKHDSIDLIKATFPAGTLSGAPKIRAIEIINDLESERRGVYGGCVGYFGFDGNMDTAITIRTMQIHNGEISFQAGAGIVYDSDAETEYEETIHKSNAIRNAIEFANNNLSLA